MTVPVPGSLTYSYDEDGITTVFAYPVRFFEPQELEVVREVGGVRTTLTYNVDYTVSGAGSPSGGSITRAAATDGGKIIITRNTAWKQIVDLTNNGRNPAESVEQQLDRLTMAGQDAYERFSPLADKADDLDNAVALANAAANAAEDAQAAAEGAAANASGATPVADRAAMKALETATKRAAVIYDEGSRNGTFVFVSDDLSAEVTADTEETIYVAPGSDPTGASGAWVRVGGATGVISAPDMAYAYVTSGYRLQEHEAGNAVDPRPGDAFQRYIVPSHIPDPDQVSQQDSVLYIEARVPDVELPLANEFAAVRFNMASKANDGTTGASNADIKGLQGIVVGDGGNSKVRSIRTTSASINGHYGIVTGGMFAAHRSGVIPTVAPFGGNGIDEWQSGQAGPYASGDGAVIGQVGPGIQAVFRAQGFAGKERPQTAFQQERGNQAILPEIAVFDVHGGGNGQIMRIMENEESSVQIGGIDRFARAFFPAFRSGRAIGVADDEAISFTPRTVSGFIFVYAETAATNWVVGYFRAAGSSIMTSIAEGSAASVATGVLSGTTGVDGELTVSSNAADGKIYVENRTGAVRNLTYFIIGNP